MTVREILRGFPRAPAPGRPGDAGLFEPGSAAWKVNGEVAMLAGGGRSLLLQIAHPSVAAAVAEHGDFPADPYARLWRTLGTMLDVTFGDTARSNAAAERVNALHRTITGATYRATDPELLLWVHATLVDSALVVYERFVGSLRPEEREAYHGDMCAQAELFGVPERILPKDLGSFRRYVDDTVASLEITATARELAADIVSPPVPLALVPSARTFEVLTIGLLPERIRDAYGFRWGAIQRAVFAAARGTIRSIVPVLPSVLRRWPHARQAARRVQPRGDPVEYRA